MGYEVHITRAEEWTESEDAPISLEEWRSIVASDPEMRLDGFAEATTTQGERIKMKSPGIAVWTAWSGHQRNGNMAWFDFFQGRIVVKNPDKEILKKMASIARRLSARVQGDEGELYD